MCSTESLSDPNSGSSNQSSKTPDTTTNSSGNNTSNTNSGVSKNPNRRSNKPIMEKRRRARINNCLNELKSILLEAMKKDPARHSKLEKADILELTVSHLKTLHSKTGNRNSNNPSESNYKKFCDGFAECATEVSRFLNSPKAVGIDPGTTRRLMSHLSESLNNITQSMIGISPQRSPPLPLLCHSGTGPPSHILTGENNHHNLLGISPNTPIISLVPSRLSSGEIAFVVPNHLSNSSVRTLTNSGYHSPQSHTGTCCSPSEKPLELTLHSINNNNININSCPIATSSPSSTTSSLSPALFQHPGYPQQQVPSHFYNNQFSIGHGQPLALVTQKRTGEENVVEMVDMSCWRPW